MQSVTSIQLLRALSAWMVVGHHYMQFFYNLKSDSALGAFFATYGNIGVDVFFIISGFIMVYSLTLKTRTAKQFLIGRISRIVPVYWFYTFLAIVVAQVCVRLGSYPWTAASLLKSLFFIPHENPAGLGLYPLLLVGWTLNVEMFFYSVLALMMLVLKRYYFAVVAMLFVALPLVWQEGWVLAPLLDNSRLSEFSIGILFGMLYCRRNFFEKLKGILIGTVFLGLLFWVYKNNSVYMLQFYASLLVFCALFLEKNLNTPYETYKPLVLLGDMSYSTYLSHVLIIVIFRNYIVEPPTRTGEVFIIAALTLCIGIVSFISYKYIEKGWFFKVVKQHA